MSDANSQIPLFDIAAQHQPIQDQLKKAVLKVLESHGYILGPEGKAFETEFAKLMGVPYAIGVSSGTSALHLAVQALGLKKDEAVLTTPFTFIGTTIGVLSAGAQVQFADIDPKTFTIDPNQVESRAQKNTKTIMPVHLYGYPADMGPIMQIAGKKNLSVIEDCAQSHLAEYKGKRVGQLGDIGCFSFYVSKNLGAIGDAGACVTKSAEIDKTLRILRNNGSSLEDRYNHILKGYNARLDDIQAAVLRIKLAHLETWTQERKKRAQILREALAGLPLELPPADGERGLHAYHLFIVRLKERDRLKDHLAKKGIASGVYYPIPLHLQPAYEDLGFKAGDFPHSERAAQEVLALPVFPELSLDNLRRIADEVRAFFKQGK